jgi:hypothetical protein
LNADVGNACLGGREGELLIQKINHTEDKPYRNRLNDGDSIIRVDLENNYYYHKLIPVMRDFLNL